MHNKLDEALRRGSKIKILRFLFEAKDEHTGRAIAKAIGMSASSVYLTLQKMKEEKIITARRKGNAILYKLQEDNYVVKKLLEPLFNKEKAVYSDITSLIKKELLRQRKEIVSIAVYGSVASRAEAAGSDIDLLVVIKNGAKKTKIDEIIDKLCVVMANSFGAAISPYLLTKTEIRHKHAKNEPIIKSILDNNRLIYGEPIERVLA